MLYTGHSILESGIRKNDIAAQAQGLMILAEYASLTMDASDWAKHVTDLVGEGLDKDLATTILPEAVAQVVAKKIPPAAVLVEQALFRLKQLRGTDDFAGLMRAFMARMFTIELDAIRAGEALELEERIARTVLDIPLAFRPSADEQIKLVLHLNQILSDEDALGGFVPVECGTALSGALALRVALEAFRKNAAEEELAAVLCRLGDELQAQNKAATHEQCIEVAARLLRREHEVYPAEAVVERAKRRDFPTHTFLVGPQQPPPGSTLH